MFSTIKGKFIFGVMALILFIQLSSSLFQFFQMRSVLNDGLKSEALNLSTPIYESLIKNLSYTQAEDTDAILAQMDYYADVRMGVNLFPKLIEAQKKLKHIQFVDYKGKILGHDTRGKRGQQAREIFREFLRLKQLMFVEEDQEISVFVPFIYQNRFFGGLIFGYSKKQFNEETNRIKVNFISLLSIYILIGGIGAVLLSGTILKPINELTANVERLTDGHLEERIDTSRKDELGRLAKTFAYMRDSIREKIKVIEEANRTLEQNVETRTIELKKKTLESEATKEELKKYSQELQEKNILIEEQNITLEKKVAERTQELEKSNQELQNSINSLNKAQQQLIIQEKMASLGGLVAGVAHEINTPVGIGVSLSSHLNKKTKELYEQFKKDTLYQEDLEAYLNVNIESTDLILDNLNRSSELINSFKKIAVDQSSEKKRLFNVREYLDQILLNLQPKLKRTPHKVSIKCNKTIQIDCYPGAFSQIITNLFMNSIIHGFDHQQAGKISIDVQPLDENNLSLTYRDNGKGIPENIIGNIFDPFFTTTRSEGGSGLGLHIIYNIITQQLKGSIKVESQPGSGTVFDIEIPINS